MQKFYFCERPKNYMSYFHVKDKKMSDKETQLFYERLL
ncbi:Uncharacterized protein dnm_095690 [Desulfonema magnum]|uniref:Uncharacterized protein n=1 Tax=Desulfonema magnum TaxID=45655 RepID=A0A975BY63_9BACT|nr:Uncharacterized protein dnm_095690 [Desulfonema magnum]